MNSSKNDKTKFSILINDELKSSIDDENDDDDDSNEKPLLDRKDKMTSKRKILNTKKGGYYELSKQDRDNVNEMFDSTNSKVVNAVDYDDDEYEEDDEDYKDEESNEQTQLTRSKKQRSGDKKSIRKKLFGSTKNSKQSLNKQSSTDDELSLGKIKILIPRKKNKSKLIRYKVRKFVRNFVSLFFLLIALVVIFILLYFKRQYLNQLLKDHLSQPSSSVKRTLDKQSKHCDMLIVNNLWNISLPKLVVEKELRLLDGNDDGVLDILVPFSTTIDQARYDTLYCGIYFNQTAIKSEEIVCGGGLLLLNGQTGEELWRVYTKHGLTSVTCMLDLDSDKINDCFATGPRAQLLAISGGTGRIIWKIDAQQIGEPFQSNAAFHTPLLIPRDLDRDGIFDILVMHGGDYQRKTKSASARLICLSSRDGSILLWSHVNDGQDSYIPPLLYYRNQKKDQDTIEIIYGTGGFNQPGSLWSINLDDFINKNTLKKSTEIYKDCCKGILTPPILIDLNNDEILDIVIALNSTVAAFNGRTFVKLWYVKFPTNTEFYVPPSIGYFDDDDVPDFFVQYEMGDGFPTTYHSEVQVLNGRDGKMMLKDSFKMLTGSRSAPITVSVDTMNPTKAIKSANRSEQTIDSFDLFLFWQTTCDNQEQELKKLAENDQIDKFKFKLKFNTINELRRTDFCHLRFGKNIVNRMHSLSFGDIMTTIYDSNERGGKELEQINRFNWTKHAANYLAKNSDLLIDYVKSLNADSNYGNDERDEQSMNNDKRNPNYNENDNPSLSSFNKGFYIPGLNDKIDYSSFKRPNNYPLYDQQDKNEFNQPNYNPPNDPFNQNNLVNLLNQFQQQQQAKQSPPYLQGFDLNNMNNRNKFVKKKSSPYDLSILDDMFQRRRNKRSTDEPKLIHQVFTTATLAPSDLKNGIDLVFATNWIPENRNVKLIKKSEYDNCLEMARKSKGVQSFSNKNLLSELMSYCDKEMSKNDETKKWTKEQMTKKQMGSTIIYRNSLICKNGDFHMKSYNKQIWPAYMGILANGMANA